MLFQDSYKMRNINLSSIIKWLKQALQTDAEINST